MGAEAPATGKKHQPPPPALFLVRARSRATGRVAHLGGAAAWESGAPPDTPPRRSPVTVPFLWEEAPGKPKAPPQQGHQGDAGNVAPAAAAVPVGATTDTTTRPAGAGDHANDSGGAAEEEAARPVPLKLPPRLQRVASATQQRDGSLSPKAVLHGPYYYGFNAGGKRQPRRTASGFAAFRRTPSAGVGRFSWSNKKKGSGHDYRHGHPTAASAPDAPWCSPAASSASSTSSSSSSMSTSSCFGDDHGHGGGHRRPVDAREDDEECARASVKITRLRRNRSFPSMMTTSHLWASIRKSVKQITPWS